MHGIWTWISDENRAVIVDFVRRKLKVGGVFYISYNTEPGWAASIPLRHLLFEHSEVMSAAGQGAVSRVDAAINFTERLFALNPAYLQANPAIVERFKTIKEGNRQYLAHEYFNRDWKPMLITDMAKWLSPAKIDYACSAHYLDGIDKFNLTDEQHAFLQEIPDPLFKEMARDYIVNQQFRRDYWVKGGRKLSLLEQAEAMRKQRVILTTLRADVSLKMKIRLGEVALNPEVYTPILDTLADYQPKTLMQIENAVKNTTITFAQLWQTIMVLVNNSHVSQAQDGAHISKAKVHTDKLNLQIMMKARAGSEVNYLASPVTGGGVIVNRFNQLFLLARLQGKKQPNEWVHFVWQILAAQNQNIVKEGKTLATVEENMAELAVFANDFAEKQLPVLKGLGIA